MNWVNPAKADRKGISKVESAPPGLSPRRKPKGVLPPSPAPSPWGKGRPRLFHARGFAPCIPGAEPGRHGLTCKQLIPPLMRRTVGSRLRGAGGGAPAKTRVFLPPSPAPSPWGKGRPRLFHARGFAPCIPGAGRGAARVEPAEQAPGGGRTPGVGGSASRCGARRGLALLVACQPRL